MIIPDNTIMEGSALFGVDPKSMQSMGGSDGAVYSCRRENRACTIKFAPLSSERLAAFEEKLAFILYLADNGVPVAVPQESKSGRRCEVLPAAGGMYVVTVTNLASGRHPTPRNPYDWNERLFACWGQVMGKMHQLARAYPRWQKSAPGDDSPPSQITGWQGEHASFAGWCKDPKVTAQWQKLYEPLAALPRERGGFGLIHNDLHMWNFLYNPDAHDQHPMTIIDFDVCAYHWFITDIAIATYHGMIFNPRSSLAQREAFARHFLTHFMSGYRQENEIDPAWFAHLPLFLRYREILSYIALTNEWPEEKRSRWQTALLAEKRSRILRGEALI